MHNDHRSNKDTGDAGEWSAFLAGMLIGAGTALLFAPQRGTELRSTFRGYADRAKDTLIEQGREVWDTAVKQTKESYDQGKEVVRDPGQSQGSRPNRDRRRGGQSIQEFG